MARLGDVLVGMSLATEEQRAQAFVIYRREGGRFGTALLEAGVPEAAVAMALGAQHDVPPVTGAELEEIRQDVLRLVPLRTAQRLALLPFRREGRLLSLAMKDPKDLRALDEVSLATGLDVRAFVAAEARIDTALAKHYGARVDPRHVGAIRLSAVRRRTEDGEASKEQSTAPRKARPTTLRIVHPPPFVTSPPPPPVSAPAPAPRPAAPRGGDPSPAPARRSAARDRSDPWSSTDPRLGAVLARPQESDIVEDAIGIPAVEAPPPPTPPDPAPPPPSPRPAPRATAPAPPPDLVPERPEPTVEERLADALGDARSNDDVIEAVLAAASSYVRRAALFVVEGDHVAGWAARPEPETDLREFRLSFSEASVFATLRDTEGFYVGTYMDLPSTVKVLRALGSDGLGTMAVVPVTLKGKTVLYIWGESESYTRPPSVPALKRLAALLATGLEVVRLKARLYTL